MGIFSWREGQSSCLFEDVNASLNFGICSFARYDPKENKWTRVASMSTRRLGVAVAVLGGFLYAVGGSDGTSPLNTGVFFAVTHCSQRLSLSCLSLVSLDGC